MGAGPGGVTAAIALARKGIESTILEKATFPRDKICGDALSGKVVEVMRKIDPSLIDKIDGDPLQLGAWGVSFVAPNTQVLRVPFKKEFSKEDQAPGFISPRLHFDNFLVEEARKYPEITLREGIEARKFNRTESGWQILDKQGNPVHETGLIIAADGAHSVFAKEFGQIRMEPRHYCAGIRAYYKGVKGLDPDNFIELHFLKDFLPGYFWIFPLPNGMANVGVGMRSDKVSQKKVNLKKEMLRIIEEYPELRDRFEGAELQGPIKGFGLPLGSKKRPISGDRFLLVGDAASLIDPFTGEGIGNAMYTGLFAAEQVEKCLSANDFSAAFMRQYDTATYDRLWSELKLSKRMQELVKFPWLFNLVVNKARKNKALSEMISVMFEDLDLREKLKNPAFYFQLLFSNGGT